MPVQQRREHKRKPRRMLVRQASLKNENETFLARSAGMVVTSEEMMEGETFDEALARLKMNECMSYISSGIIAFFLTTSIVV